MSKKHKKKARSQMSWDWDYEEPTHAPKRKEPCKKITRNKIDGMIGGVCAGIGDYIGLDHTVTRIITVLLFIFTGLPLIVYPILWLCVPKDKRAPYVREYREARRAKREHPEAPIRTVNFRDVKSKFRSLETRLQDLERSITSKEWKLNREFRDL